MGDERNAPLIDAALLDDGLVRMLVAEQFPEWAPLPIRRLERGGNDHRMFRLGEDLVVRLPSADDYVPQVEKEQTWLPRLRSQVPLPIPEVRGAGVASERFPAPWSVYEWIDGTPLAFSHPEDPVGFAAELASFLVTLRSADATGGPTPGLHSAFRGGPVAHWDAQMHDILHRVHGRERDMAAGLWADAVAAEWTDPPVWVHGDVSVNNLLLRDGHLSAVIDFGCSAVGDPACDTVIVWTHLSGTARSVFRRELDLDDATWARGRGWAVWKALIMITNEPPEQRALAQHVLDELAAEA